MSKSNRNTIDHYNISGKGRATCPYLKNGGIVRLSASKQSPMLSQQLLVAHQA